MTSTCNNNPEAAKIHPNYLKSNASVHTWVFSAIAELIDNAYDANSKELLIDIVEKHGKKCLCFQDNGVGMDRNKLFKMLSFGFTTEYSSCGRYQLGMHGNGFKSGSMRLGDDALVFTRSKSSACIGFLSWTYLVDIKADSVLVPILEYKLPDLDRMMTDNFDENLRIILKYSPFEDEDELKAELHRETVGTKIFISELIQFQNDDNLELNFSADQRDIQCSHDEHTPKYKYSLREYCSILFLLPRMKIKLRGEKVKTKIISECLTNSRPDFYKPALQGHKVKVTFGFTNETSEDCGMMLYHRNRLIMAFQRLRCQMQAEPVGIGVIGVTKVNFLTPIHNKQDFTREDKKFESAMKAYNAKLKQYVNEMGKETSESHPLSASRVNWVQCDECMKWRRLSDDNDEDSLPREWFCRLNPDKNFNNCDVPQELEADDEDDLPSTNEIPGKKGAKATTRRNPTRKRSAAKSLSVSGRAGTSSGSQCQWLRTSKHSQGTSSDKQGTSSYRQGTLSERQALRSLEKSKKEMSRKGEDEGARQRTLSDSESDMDVDDNKKEEQGAESFQSRKGFGRPMANLSESSSTSDEETPTSESVDQPGEDDKTPTMATSGESASSRKSATSREPTTSRESATPRESAKRGQAASIKKRRSYRELEIELSEMKMNVIKLLEFLNPGVDLRRIKDKEKLIKDMVVELEKDQASQGKSTNAAE